MLHAHTILAPWFEVRNQQSTNLHYNQPLSQLALLQELQLKSKLTIIDAQVYLLHIRIGFLRLAFSYTNAYRKNKRFMKLIAFEFTTT